MKTVAGRQLILTAMPMQIPVGKGTRAIGYHCQVGGVEPTGDLVGAARAFMGRPPTDDFGSVVDWVFIERDGQRVFFPDGLPATLRAALKNGSVEMVVVPKHGLWAGYDELVAAP
jgi:hypothetical protein